MSESHDSYQRFDVVLRGYHRAQVIETIKNLEAALQTAITERDTAVHEAAVSSELTLQVSSLREEMAALHGKATAAGPVTNMGERISAMLRLAEEEADNMRRAAEKKAAEIRRAAEQHAAQLSQSAAAEAEAAREQIAAEARAFGEHQAGSQAEAGRLVAAAHQHAEQIVAKAQARADELTAKTEERVAHLDADAQARQAQAEEDFQLALRARRAEAARREEERVRILTPAVEQLVAAGQLATEAAARVKALLPSQTQLGT